MKTIQFSLRRSMPFIALLLSSIFCFSQTGSATTYYISPSGNDATGTGTSVNPWKTLFKATTVASAAGDIIHVNAGTYIETQQSTLKVGVSIQGDGVTSIIKSTENRDFQPIINAISAEGTIGNQRISYLKFDGQALTTDWAINIIGRSNIEVDHCTFIDFQDRGIIISGNSYSGEFVSPTVYATGNSFHDNVMNNCAGYNIPGTGTYGRGALNVGAQDGMLIYNNVITQNSRPEGYNGWPIKYNNGGWLKNCKVYGNTLTKIPLGSTNGVNGWDFAIEFYHEAGTEIYNNTIIGAGIDANYQTTSLGGTSYAYSVWIHNNTIKNLTPNPFRQAAITLEFDTDGAIVENNTIDNQSIGVYFTPRASNTVKNITIQKNLMTLVDGETGGNFIDLGGSASQQFFENINIYNNTMIYKAGYSSFFGIALPKATSGYIKKLQIKNNILSNANYQVITQPGWSTVVMDSLNISNNNIYSCGSGNMPAYNGSGSGLHYVFTANLNITPSYNSNYTLPTGSPLIDAGTYVGLAYAGLAPDRGYAEVGVALPIRLMEFTAVKNGSKNQLSWKTAVESNSDHFSVERSGNGRDFTAIGIVAAAGFSSTEKNYGFTDAAPLEGINYYRLIMIDRDLSKDYSNIVSLSNKTDQFLSIVTAQISSNNRLATFTVVNPQSQSALLSLYDGNGRLFLNEKIQLQKGTTSFSKNTQSITKGIYYAKITAGEETAVKNMLTKD